MKRFEFSLEKPKRFREAQLRLEEGRYGLLRAAEAQLRDRITELRTSQLDQRQAISRGTAMDGSQLEQLHHFSAFVASEVARLNRECQSLRVEIEAQEQHIAECRRRVELLEKFKDTELMHWNQESAKQTQAAAEESYNARWLRDRRS